MMGLRVIAPKPLRSRDPFDVVNAADAARETITADKSFPAPGPSNDGWIPLPSKVDLLPDQPPPDKEAVRQANIAQYAAVKTAWETPVWKREETEGFVAEWQKALKWDEGIGLEKLVGMPAKVKANFDDLYVAAPLFAQGVPGK